MVHLVANSVLISGRMNLLDDSLSLSLSLLIFYKFIVSDEFGNIFTQTTQRHSKISGKKIKNKLKEKS